MKFSTTSALLALSAIASAAPAEHEAIEKRAVCTYFGFTYSCAGSGTTPATSTRAATTAATVPATTTATTASATSTGGSSTGGASKYTSGSSATDITSNTGCTELTVIFARGTSEGGNIGSVAGPPMYKQLLSDLGASKLTLQGVDYPADAAGNSNCGAAGGGDMADKVQTILSRCPNTKIALSGYSQGACVVHNAVQSQGVDASKIGAVVLFGDPFNGQSVGSIPSSKVLEICAGGDSICGGSGGGAGHTSYGSNAAQAATFIENTTGTN